jgi:hypothetical protein
MESYQALYYPYVHFKDDAWVKLSALYWDKLKRIVPEDYPTDDSVTVRGLGTFIETVRPDAVKPAFAKTFSDFFGSYGAQLRKTYALANRDQWPVVPLAQRPPAAGGASGIDMRLGYVRYEKINDDVYRSMKEHGLASTDERGAKWIGMHPRLASVYMHALAEHIAEHRGLRPLTDETFDHVALSQLSLERLANALLGDVALVDNKPSSTEVETALVSVAFQALVPTDLKNLSIKKILAFREAYPNERHRFQAAVDALLKNREWLLSIDDPRVLEERLRDEVDACWAVELKELKDKLGSVGIDTMFSSANLTTALPSMVAGGIGMSGLGVNGVAVGTAAVALAAIPMMLSKRNAARDELGKSPVAYLYRMEQDLQPKDLQGWCRRGLQRFALGQ